MRPVFVGDEVTAAGYRLAGVDVRTPPLSQARDAVRKAVAENPPLLLITTEVARQCPHDELLGILAATAPPVLPVEDAAGAVAAIDLVDWIRSGIVA